VGMLPGVGLLARWNHTRERRHQALVEDALKYLHGAELRGAPVMPESLAGHLRLRVAPTLALVAEMEALGRTRAAGAGFALTASGQGNRGSSGRIACSSGISPTNRRCRSAIHSAADEERTMPTSDAQTRLAERGIGAPSAAWRDSSSSCAIAGSERGCAAPLHLSPIR
jgi:hypothetical protein